MLRYTGKPPMSFTSSGLRTSIISTWSGLASRASISARVSTLASEPFFLSCLALSACPNTTVAAINEIKSNLRMFLLPLENDLQSNLVFPSGSRRSNLADQLIPNLRVGSAECGCIGQIERLQSKLRVYALRNPESFVHAKVNVHQSRSEQNVPPRIAVGVLVIGDKGRGVEPFL